MIQSIKFLELKHDQQMNLKQNTAKLSHELDKSSLEKAETILSTHNNQE